MARARKKPINIVDDTGSVIGMIDERGTVLRREQVAGLAGLADGFVPWGSIGGDAWEWLHPGTVQKEYEAVGKEPPSRTEIMEGAAQDALDRASENVAQTINMGQNLGRWIVIGLVAYAAIQLLSHIPKPRGTQ